MISFTVPGSPVSQGRPRVTRAGIVYYDAKTKAYRETVKQCATEAQEGRDSLTGPCAVIVECLFVPPESWPKYKREAALRGMWHIKKPDTDNVVKAVTDSMSGIVYEDDNQIAIAVGMKRYAENDATKVTVIDLSAIDNPRWLMASIKRVVKSVDLEPRFRV